MFYGRVLPFLLAMALAAGCGVPKYFAKETTYYEEGLRLARHGKDAEAVQLLREALASDGDHRGAHFALAVLYDDAGRFEEAIAEYLEVLRIDHTDTEARYRLAIVYATQAIDEQAILHLQDVVAAEPGHVMAHYNLAVLLDVAQELEGSREHYEKVLEMKPNHAAALNNLGMIYAREGSLDDARRYIQKAVAARPGYVEALNNLGIVLAKQGQYPAALRNFQEAVRHDGTSPESLYNLAKLCFEYSREYDLAATYARRYLELSGYLPHIEEMAQLSRKAQNARGKIARAALGSVEGRVKRDVLRFLQAAQRGDFRDYWIFQAPEMRRVLSKAQWDRDMVDLEPGQVIAQRNAIADLVGFEDLYALDVHSVQMLADRQARVLLIQRFEDGERTPATTAMIWREQDGRWAPASFLSRVRDNWRRAEVDSLYGRLTQR